jgi:DNA-binding CsgD family transcriptional regulator
VEFKYRPGWRSLVVFAVLNTYLVTITFQVQVPNDDTNQNYFSMLRTLLSVYLGNLESGNAIKHSNSHRTKQDLLGRELTERQTEILELVREGLTNVSIAAKIGYSESLIKQETIAIYQKLGIVGRREINGSLN